MNFIRFIRWNYLLWNSGKITLNKMRLELVGWEKFYALRNNGKKNHLKTSFEDSFPSRVSAQQAPTETLLESCFLHAQTWDLAEMPYTSGRAQNSELRIWKKYSNVYHWRLFIEFSSELIEVLWMKYPRKIFCKID